MKSVTIIPIQEKKLKVKGGFTVKKNYKSKNLTHNHF
jgi:hypothetical protein